MTLYFKPRIYVIEYLVFVKVKPNVIFAVSNQSHPPPPIKTLVFGESFVVKTNMKPKKCERLFITVCQA